MKTLAFLQNASRKGTMTETDYETYKGLFDAMVMTPYFPHPDLLIYLEGSFDDIVDRIQERGRPMEQQTPIEYWKEMHGRYENWINNFNSCPVLRLNINEYDILKDGDSIEPIIKNRSFLKQTRKLVKKPVHMHGFSIKLLFFVGAIISLSGFPALIR